MQVRQTLSHRKLFQSPPIQGDQNNDPDVGGEAELRGCLQQGALDNDVRHTVYASSVFSHISLPSGRPLLSQVLMEGGYIALLSRGLGTKIFSNAVQGICFTVFWQLFQEWYTGKGSKGAQADTAPAAAAAAGPAEKTNGQAVEAAVVVGAATERRGGTSSRGDRSHSREPAGSREGGVGPVAGATKDRGGHATVVVAMGSGPAGAGAEHSAVVAKMD